MASLKPSIDTVKISSIPLVLNSSTTFNQNLELLFSPITTLKIFFPSKSIPKTTYAVLFKTFPLLLILKCIASMNTKGYHFCNGLFF